MELIRRLAEDDKEGVMAHKVKVLVLNFFQCDNFSFDIVVYWTDGISLWKIWSSIGQFLFSKYIQIFTQCLCLLFMLAL